MRRTDHPFNGKPFILNKSTGEIHDLDRESPLCCIDIPLIGLNMLLFQDPFYEHKFYIRKSNSD